MLPPLVRTSATATPQQTILAAGHHLVKLLLIPFFTFHYGMFCMVHGVFIFALLGDQGPFGLGQGPFGGLQQKVVALLNGGTLVAILGLIGSHLFSYGYHFLYQGELRLVASFWLMMLMLLVMGANIVGAIRGGTVTISTFTIKLFEGTRQHVERVETQFSENEKSGNTLADWQRWAGARG